MKLSNIKYAGKSLVTGFGTIKFDENGDANVSDEAVKALIQLPGFTTDYTTPADNEDDDPPAPGKEGDNPGDVEHTEGDGQVNPQGDGSDTQNDDESTQNDENGGKEGKTDEDDDPPAPAAPEFTEDELKKLQVPSLKKLCKDRGINLDGVENRKQAFIDLLMGR